jgi:hypothetical protein
MTQELCFDNQPHNFVLLEKLAVHEAGYRHWEQPYLFYCTKCLKLQEIERETR